MAAPIVVHGFETSNNIKVRIALGLKGLDYDFRAVDPAQRDELVRISGQHLTPVLEHGDAVLFDSAAILRYLDANFRDTPRLFGGSRDEQWEIEDWELFARTELAGPMMTLVHGRLQGVEISDEVATRAADAFGAAVATLARRLDGREWLAGDCMSAADITAASVMFRIRSAELLPIPPDSSGTEGWERTVLAYDGVGRRA